MTGWPALSLSLSGLLHDAAAPGDRLRVLVRRAAALGFTGVHLDATFPSLRPRELDRSARKEIGAMLRSASLSCSGVDLFIPAGHFHDEGRVERALQAVLGALELAADLARFAAQGGSARPVASTRLHPQTGGEVVAAIEQRCHDLSAALADHAWPLNPWAAPPGAAPRAGGGEMEGIGAGLDAAGLLGAGADPAGAAAALGRRLVSARISPSCVVGNAAGRGAAGAASARLDPLAFGVALMTAGFGAHVVVDLGNAGGGTGGGGIGAGGGEDWEAAARGVVDAWAPPGTATPSGDRNGGGGWGG